MDEDKNNSSDVPAEQPEAEKQDEVLSEELNEQDVETQESETETTKDTEVVEDQPVAGDEHTTTVSDVAETSGTQSVEAKPAEVETKEKKKPKVVWYGIIAAFLALAGTLGLVLTLTGDKESQEPVASETQQESPAPVTTLGAEIAIAEGAVEISTDGGTTWVETPGSESVANLDYVRTLDDSRAVILFDDGSVARLDKNTEVYLSSLERDGLEMTLLKGQVYTRVVESETTPFTVITANERFTSLGTAYKTSTDGEKDELEVYQSSVKVTSADVEVSEGNKYDTETKQQTAIDLAELQDDEFAQWNKEQDSANEDFKDKLGVLGAEPKEEEQPAQEKPRSTESTGITLTASQFDGGVTLSWKVLGASAGNGFKVVRSESPGPRYGTDSAQYVGKNSTSHKWWDDNGGTHYYRVCIYRENGTCDTYSNEVKAASPKVDKAPVVSGDITLTIDGNKLSWSLVGGTAPHGFKVVMSDSSGPEYPGDSIQYVGAESTTAKLPNKANGTYYVRVCKYTNGTQDAGCVDYSNEVEYVVSN